MTEKFVPYHINLARESAAGRKAAEVEQQRLVEAGLVTHRERREAGADNVIRAEHNGST